MAMRVGSQASLHLHRPGSSLGWGWNSCNSKPVSQSPTLSSQAHLLKVLQPPQTVPHLETESSNGSLWGTFHIVQIGAWFQPLSAELLSVPSKPMPEQEEH